MSKDTKARKAIEGSDKPADGDQHPPAGPHAKEHLTDKMKTPGAGSLPDDKDESVSPGAG